MCWNYNSVYRCAFVWIENTLNCTGVESGFCYFFPIKRYGYAKLGMLIKFWSFTLKLLKFYRGGRRTTHMLARMSRQFRGLAFHRRRHCCPSLIGSGFQTGAPRLFPPKLRTGRHVFRAAGCNYSGACGYRIKQSGGFL